MRLVTTLLARTLADLDHQARQATTAWIEVRFDALAKARPADVAAARSLVRQKAIATCRASSQRGGFAGSEQEREALLRAAVMAGFEAIDVEADARFLRRLAGEARRAGVELIVSRHDAQPAPAKDVERFLDDVPAGAIAKYAAGVEGAEDLAALVGIAALARRRGVRFAVMGLGDSSLRLLAPLLGCELVYCASTEGAPAAPGQLPASMVAQVHALLPRAAAVTGAHRLVVLLGDPVAHSLSPAMQNAAFAAQGDALLYAAVRVRARDLPKALQGLAAAGLAGANVTAPHKQAALRLVDRVAPEAQRAAAVNTIVVRGSRLAGHNTDGAGALAALREAHAPLDGSALVLGAGGTGRAVAHALAEAGVDVLVANRTPAKARALARAIGGEAVAWRRGDLRDALARARVLVHATPLGRDGKASPVPSQLLHDKLTVLDAVYRPGGTPLARAALARGCNVVPGEALLLHQGARAYQLWTGMPAPLGTMRHALLTEGGSA
ncbi:MAG TPA: shikimate dehydrogenase [Candidatus Thermoplasmatota archaeon]|jgi:shikimate dehydrogenase|nr:shikimate dehydrogenase [Candidatus Thermoplasmatota archaeon]